MIYTVAPEPEMTWPILFLAGGITGCFDWQNELIERLDAMELEAIVANPRRENFPMDDPSAAYEQIAWEHRMLDKADIISFWFPAESLCPITLFELGKHLHKSPLIGVEPGYARALDIRVQTELEFTHYEISDSIADLSYQIQNQVWMELNS